MAYCSSLVLTFLAHHTTFYYQKKSSVRRKTVVIFHKFSMLVIKLLEATTVKLKMSESRSFRGRFISEIRRCPKRYSMNHKKEKIRLLDVRRWDFPCGGGLPTGLADETGVELKFWRNGGWAKITTFRSKGSRVPSRRNTTKADIRILEGRRTTEAVSSTQLGTASPSEPRANCSLQKTSNYVFAWFAVWSVWIMGFRGTLEKLVVVLLKEGAASAVKHFPTEKVFWCVIEY